MFAECLLCDLCRKIVNSIIITTLCVFYKKLRLQFGSPRRNITIHFYVGGQFSYICLVTLPLGSAPVLSPVRGVSKEPAYSLGRLRVDRQIKRERSCLPKPPVSVISKTPLQPPNSPRPAGYPKHSRVVAPTDAKLATSLTHAPSIFAGIS